MGCHVLRDLSTHSEWPMGPPVLELGAQDLGAQGSVTFLLWEGLEAGSRMLLPLF